MFSQKLDLLMNGIGAKNAEVAAYAGFDRTNISRFRSGARLPEPSSRSAKRLVNGLYLYADDNDKIDILCSVAGIDSAEQGDDIKLALLKWLYDGEHSVRESGRFRSFSSISRQNQAQNPFSTRLTEVMKIADISNISLSRLLNIDASLISRYRTGLCMPRLDSDLVDRISSILYRRIRKNEGLPALSGIMRCNPDELTEARFAAWLFDFDTGIPAEESAMARLLEIFEAYDPGEYIASEPGDLISQERLNDNRREYFGTKGLRDAVIRFLMSVEHNGGKELMLYSDQDMSWMTRDEEFRVTWSVLMSRCVKKGVRIRIIHNINRNLGEMNMAIKSWLPLYMSGMIEPYYNESERDTRFSHTLFICPHVAAIEAFNAVGAEDSGIYHYYSDADCIKACLLAYDRLMDNAEPLVRTGPPDTGSGYTSDITIIRNTLSIRTMPKELVDEFADDRLNDIWKVRNRTFNDIVKIHDVFEYVALPDANELARGITGIERYSQDISMDYDRRQYEMHLDNILRLCDENERYHFCILPGTVLKNMTMIMGDDFVEIIYDKLPDFSISFTHPHMLRAFHAFADRLRRMCRLSRSEVRRAVERWENQNLS